MSEITISTGHPDAGRVYAEALDRVTAERDAALGREVALLKEREITNRHIDRMIEHDDELQQRLTESQQREAALQALLTAADERADVLEGLLRRSQDFVAFVHKCVRRNGEYAPLHRQEMDELNRDLSDHVEPGVPVCEQCRGEGRVGGPAPAEGGGGEYRKSCEAAQKALSMENQRITPVRRETDPRVIDALREAGYLRND